MRKNIRIPELKLVLILLIFFAGTYILDAQPSGGPYGPVKQKYKLPEVKGKIYYVAVDGKADADGSSVNKPTTINEAFNRVNSGDAVILRGGTYRTGNLTLNQGITIQPFEDEQPVLKGTYIAKDWKDLKNGLWKTKWTRLFPSKPANWWVRDRYGKLTPQHRFNDDMVFADGKFLQSAGWEGEVDSNSYHINYDSGFVYIGVNPTHHLIEITAFNIGIYRVKGDYKEKVSDHIGPIIKGISFLQYAYRAIEVEGTDPEGISEESKHGKEVVGTTIENCEISYCSRVAAYLRGDKLTLRNCKVSETSTEGIYILSSSDVLLERNIFTHNNIENITGYYPAAVKIFNQCYRVTCRDNLVIDLPNSNGIWYDVGNVDGVFINNWVENVGNNARIFNPDRPWPSENGFFFEISKGVICAGNVFVNCDQGIFILNSSNARIYNNTLINSTVCIGRNERSAVGDHFGWHPSTGPDVDKREGHVFKNNLLYGNINQIRPLLFVWQPKAMCAQLPASPLKEADNNVFIHLADSIPVILWSPYKNDKCRISVNTQDELTKINPGFFAKSLIFDLNSYTVFKGPEIFNFQLMPSFPGLKVASGLPQELLNIPGIKKVKPYIGAYPVKE